MIDWSAIELPSEERLAETMARSLGRAFVSLEDQYISAGIRAKVPVQVAIARRWVPLVFNVRRVVLVTDDPFQAVASDPREVLEELGVRGHREVEFGLTTPGAMDRYLGEHYASPSTDGS